MNRTEGRDGGGRKLTTADLAAAGRQPASEAVPGESPEARIERDRLERESQKARGDQRLERERQNERADQRIEREQVALADERSERQNERAVEHGAVGGVGQRIERERQVERAERDRIERERQARAANDRRNDSAEERRAAEERDRGRAGVGAQHSADSPTARGASASPRAGSPSSRTEGLPTQGREKLEPLFPPDVAERYRSEWAAVQSSFVDDPRQAAARGDELVAQVMKGLAESFAHEREQLEQELSRSGEASTETLRIGFRRYRSFFERLLAL